MTLLYFIAPVVLAILLSYGLTPLASALARRIGAVDTPGDRKIHTTPKPRLGGLAVAGSIVIVLTTLSILQPVSTHQLAPEVLLALAAGLLPIVIVSIVDDIRPQRAALKFAVHLSGATIAVILGIRLNEVVHFGDQQIAIGWLAIPISILWLAGITNAFNLIDGLDGLSAGLALISALSLVAVSLVTGRYGMAATAAVLAGAIIGFLPYNF
ncbi:MAG: glycosyltransferase family 4 protein, partial [Thermoanaerobaculia bacterium]